MSRGEYFKGVYFTNHTPLRNDVIASASAVWKKAKTLGVTCVFCDCAKQIVEDTAHIVSVSFSKRF